MNLLLRNATLVGDHSPHNQSVVNIKIEDGVITGLSGDDDLSADNELDLDGCLITSGWFDLNAYFADPGFESKEDLQSGITVAQSGGFTDVHLMAHTNPPIQSKSQLEYIKSRSGAKIDLHPEVALTKELSAGQLNDLLDLKQAGGVSIGNGDLPIQNEMLLLNVLRYTAPAGIPIFQNAFNAHLSEDAQMHEGVVSTELGMKGDPSLSEELAVMRDLELIKYAGGRLHFTKISASRSVDLIRKAKSEGLAVTCDVGIHNLIFTDASVGTFNSVFKNQPPYRSEEDRLALIEGLKDGTIDAISSNHRPQDQESKDLEYNLADPGSTSLQTFCSSLLKLVSNDDVSLSLLIEKVTNGPRKVLGMDTLTLEAGMPAKLTIIKPDEEWTLNEQTNLSKSKNSPFWNQKLMGKIYGTVNGYSVSLPL